MNPYFMQVVLLLVLAFASDRKTYKVKNFITLPFALAGIATNLMEKGVGGLWFSLSGWALPVALLFVFFALKVLGAGDIKLFAAIGAIMGGHFAVYSIAFSFLAGGLIGILLLLIRRNLAERVRYLGVYLKSCMLTHQLLPYGDMQDLSRKDKFRFTYAIVPGTAFQLMMRALCQ